MTALVKVMSSFHNGISLDDGHRPRFQIWLRDSPHPLSKLVSFYIQAYKQENDVPSFPSLSEATGII